MANRWTISKRFDREISQITGVLLFYTIINDCVERPLIFGNKRGFTLTHVGKKLYTSAWASSHRIVWKFFVAHFVELSIIALHWLFTDSNRTFPHFLLHYIWSWRHFSGQRDKRRIRTRISSNCYDFQWSVTVKSCPKMKVKDVRWKASPSTSSYCTTIFSSVRDTNTAPCVFEIPQQQCDDSIAALYCSVS